MRPVVRRFVRRVAVSAYRNSRTRLVLVLFYAFPLFRRCLQMATQSLAHHDELPRIRPGDLLLVVAGLNRGRTVRALRCLGVSPAVWQEAEWAADNNEEDIPVWLVRACDDAGPLRCYAESGGIEQVEGDMPEAVTALSRFVLTP